MTVRLSSGPDLIRVPDVHGLPPGPARARLLNAGLRPTEPLIAGGEGAPGTISSSDPSAGEEVQRGTEVLLTIVPEVTTVEVPDFTGQSIRRARAAIEEAGFVVGETRQRFDDLRAPYVVLSQTPEAGTQAEPGSTIDLVMNEGD